MTISEVRSKYVSVGLAAMALFMSIFFSAYAFSYSSDPVGIYLGVFIGVMLIGLQFVGNDATNRDEVFFWVWIISYMYDISSNAFGIYTYVDQLPFAVRMGIAVPLGAIISIVPERMIMVAIGKRVTQVIQRKEKPAEHEPVRHEHKPAPQHSTYKPQHRPQLGSKVPPSPQRPPEHRRSDYDDRDPTYRMGGLLAGENRRHEKERYDERD